MPRKPRFYLPGVPAHVIQCGNCRQAVFFDDNDYRAYLTWLAEGAKKYGCTIHAYVLMTNHVHLLMTPNPRDAISETVQHVGCHYVTYVNLTYGKSGTLWEGRHKGCVIDSEQYLLTCMRYIELNSVRAKMVRRPSDYPWSSYAYNAAGKRDNLITPHPAYLSMGSNQEERLQVYRELFSQALEPKQIHAVRVAAQTGTPLGDNRFKEQVERTLNCKVGQAYRGRQRSEVEKRY